MSITYRGDLLARPVKRRRICSEPDYDSFVPQGIPSCETIMLSIDEYETIRIIDLERCTQEQCAKQMDVARTTVTALYESARGKIADSIVNGKRLLISGGQYSICEGLSQNCCNKFCRKKNNNVCDILVKSKGENMMRIAVTYENGEVFQHFGHTEAFKLYDIENNVVVNEQIVDTNGQGHGALADFLMGAGVNTLICGGIGGGAQVALGEAGIKFFGGVSGNADEAVKAYLSDSLSFNPDVQCSHHNPEEGHSCGENKHGCGGNC